MIISSMFGRICNIRCVCGKSFSTSTFDHLSCVSRFEKYNSRSINSKNKIQTFSKNYLGRPLRKQHFDATEADYLNVPSAYDRYVFPEPPELISEEEHNIIAETVADCITNVSRGRLFAVVYVAGKQYKVTDYDLIRTDGFMSANVGDKIRLEKVLLVGGEDFTLVGRPLLKRSLVKIEATVIEKTPGVDKVIQYFRRKKSFEKKYIYTPSHTVLRINCVEVYSNL